jgi:hypothetical protein
MYFSGDFVREGDEEIGLEVGVTWGFWTGDCFEEIGTTAWGTELGFVFYDGFADWEWSFLLIALYFAGIINFDIRDMYILSLYHNIVGIFLMKFLLVLYM